MIGRNPQEIADFFGCKVQVNPFTFSADLWDANGKIKECVGYLNHLLIHMSYTDDDKFRYEPQKNQEKSDFDKKDGSCYQDFADSDNNAPHQSEVYLLPHGGCYRTVTGYTLPEFDSKVNAAVKEGWKPVSMHVHSFESHPKVIFYMAMVRGV